MADTDDVNPTGSDAAEDASADRASHGSHLLGAERSDVPHDDVPSDDLVDELPGTEGGRELVAVGASTRASREGRASGSAAVVRSRQKKDATPRQKAEVGERRAGPIAFLRESVGELQKVVYPTGQQLLNYFVVVLIFVLFIIAIVSLLDLAFGKAILAVFS